MAMSTHAVRLTADCTKSLVSSVNAIVKSKKHPQELPFVIENTRCPYKLLS